jgi:methionyl-tRNA formyltransferase
MNAAKLLFAGTPDFALASLSALVHAGVIPLAVLTQPDRPAGRGKKMSASPVKDFAVKHSIPVWQPATLKDPEVVAQIAGLNPDLIVVAAYGLILPQAVLDIPQHGCLNVHASLLPRWRGAAPIQQAILSGDRETGISLMQMEAGLDTGPVYISAATPIDDNESAGRLHDRLAQLGAKELVKNLDAIMTGELQAVAQVEADASYAGKIRKRDAGITWSESAVEISRKIRAYNPLPGAMFKLGDEFIKCFDARVIAADEAPPGTVIAAGKDGIDVACGEDAVRMTELQRPGRRHVSAGEFAAQTDPTGKRLGWLS